LANQRRERRDSRLYLQSGKPPFTSGYYGHKWSFIQEAVADSSLLEAFRQGKQLRESYGVRLDERVVEYPWLVARLSGEAGILLDAGSALNFEQLIDLDVLKEKELHILTLAPEANCFWKRGISYAFADLRDLPLRDNLYDQIVSLSTLEHVGLNNEIYTRERVEDLQRRDYKLAASELWRVLKPGGHLYLTVPFGRPTDLDWLQQFDAAMIRDMIKILGPVKASVVYYRYGATGWNISTEEECRNCEYTPPARWGVITFSKPGEENQDLHDADPADGIPVAAGAVVCLDLLK
jgi:SAM-dependent methyltransferase